MNEKDYDLFKAVLINDIINKSFKYDPIKGFTLTSGKKSSYYFDMKPITMSGKGQHFISHMYDYIRTSDSIIFGGLQFGADPIAASLMMHYFYKETMPTQAKMFSVRKEAKDHGTKKFIEGDVNPGNSVVIVEDVVTTGGSTIKAIERATDFGLKVESVLIIVDREEGGIENILKFANSENRLLDFDVIPLIKRSEIMEVYNIVTDNNDYKDGEDD